MKLDVSLLEKQILENRQLKTAKERGSAIYGAIAALAFAGRIGEAKQLAEHFGCVW